MTHSRESDIPTTHSLTSHFIGETSSPIPLKIVSENQFSGKTYFYTIHPCRPFVCLQVGRGRGEEGWLEVLRVGDGADGFGQRHLGRLLGRLGLLLQQLLVLPPQPEMGMKLVGFSWSTRWGWWSGSWVGLT